MSGGDIGLHAGLLVVPHLGTSGFEGMGVIVDCTFNRLLGGDTVLWGLRDIQWRKGTRMDSRHASGAVSKHTKLFSCLLTRTSIKEKEVDAPTLVRLVRIHECCWSMSMAW